MPFQVDLLWQLNRQIKRLSLLSWSLTQPFDLTSHNGICFLLYCLFPIKSYKKIVKWNYNADCVTGTDLFDWSINIYKKESSNTLEPRFIIGSTVQIQDWLLHKDCIDWSIDHHALSRSNILQGDLCKLVVQYSIGNRQCIIVMRGTGRRGVPSSSARPVTDTLATMRWCPVDDGRFPQGCQ